MRKTVLGLLLLLGSLITPLVFAAPISVSPSSWSASVNINGTTSQTFTVTNNINKTLPISVSSTASSGSVSASGCASGVPAKGTCTVALTYTAPTSLPAQNPAITNSSFSYGGRNNIPVVFGSFTIGNAYTVTPSAGANGSISPSSTQTVTSGGSVTFTATPDSGYQVSGWLLDGSSYGACGTSTTCELTNVTANHTIEVDFSASTTTTITSNATDALFSFNNSNASGSIGTGYSTITITNSGSIAATTVAPSSLPSGVTLSSSSGCSSIAASGGTCTMTFTTTATPDSSQTISIAGTNTNTLSLPIAPLSVRVYSPPVNPSPTTASLMLVKTCTTPEQLLLTNNSASSISTISITKDSGLSDVSVTGAMDNCPTTLPAGKTCILAITAPSSSGSSNTQGNIIVKWGSSSIGAVFTGIEATGATLPTLSTPLSSVTVFGGYVYQEDATCNLVKIAALADEYTGSGSVAWTTSSYYSTTVPNPATGSGTGAQNTGLAAGQINTTAVIYQAGTPLTSYASGLCSQYSETSGGVNYVGWYLPWSDNNNAGSSTTELAAMYTNLSNGTSDNGFNNNQFYWSSSEGLSNFAFDRGFGIGDWDFNAKGGTNGYVRCSRALTY